MIYFPKNQTVCFTGHRPPAFGGGFDEDTPMKQQTKAFLGAIIDRLANEGFKYFISGAALGVDQWAAEAVLERSFELVLAIPHDDYDGKWAQASKDHLRTISEKAQKVITVSPGPYAAWKNQRRNEFMVDNSDVVVAVWNGENKGGTANCVRYALGRPVRLIRYNPLTGMEEPICPVDAS